MGAKIVAAVTAEIEPCRADIAVISRRWAQQFAARLPPARHLTDELAQEAAIGILRARAKYKAGKGAFEPYARLWANALMTAHVNNLGAVVRADRAYRYCMPDTSGIKSPDAEPSEPGWCDDRSTDPEALETAALHEAIERQPAHVQVMIARKLEDATYAEIAAEFGLSRETVRKHVVAFVEGL